MIEPSEIDSLAGLYDRYANAFERTSPDRLETRRQFYARLEMLYEREGTGASDESFRFELVKRCKVYLKKN